MLHSTLCYATSPGTLITMSQPMITTDPTTIDILSQPPTMGVKGSSLRNGMVLVDPELLCPCAVLGVKVKRAHDSVVTFLVRDLDMNTSYTHRFHVNAVYQVMAR